MNVIYNGTLIDEEEPFLNFENRAFQYGDGLFETIIFRKGEIMFLEDHLERLFRGLKILKISIPESLKFNSLVILINNLLKNNNLSNDARIKLVVWRKPGGLFAPVENNADFLITVKQHNPVISSSRTVDFCDSVRLSFSSFSPFKRCSSLPYVLAGIEMIERGLNDMILLDNNGNVSECLYSNIFWVKDKTYYTPSLETGCVDGIRRKNLIKNLEDSGTEVKIVKCGTDELSEANFIFSTNVAGIYPITRIRDKEFERFIPDY